MPSAATGSAGPSTSASPRPGWPTTTSGSTAAFRPSQIVALEADDDETALRRPRGQVNPGRQRLAPVDRRPDRDHHVVGAVVPVGRQAGPRALGRQAALAQDTALRVRDGEAVARVRRCRVTAADGEVVEAERVAVVRDERALRRRHGRQVSLADTITASDERAQDDRGGLRTIAGGADDGPELLVAERRDQLG